MQFSISLIFGIIFLVVAVLLIRRLLQRRQSFQEADSQTKTLETRFNMSQCRRRIQCGIMLAILAIGMIVESWVVGSVARVVFGAAMFIVLGWMVLLALFDIMLTNLYYRRMTNRYHHEQIRLEAKVKHLLQEGEADVESEDDEELP